MNIYQIKQDLLAIYDELEENGGELTEELENALAVTEETFREKVKGYIDAIKQYKADLEAITVEQKRLKALSDSKGKVIERLSKTIIEAIEEFGDTKVSKDKITKFIDYGTGKVSIRKTQAVEVDEECVKRVANSMSSLLSNAVDHNALTFMTGLGTNDLIDRVHENIGNIPGYIIDKDDLKHIKLNISIDVPAIGLCEGEEWFALKELAEQGIVSIKPAISKSELKLALREDGACAPHVAKLVENKSLNIK